MRRFPPQRPRATLMRFGHGARRRAAESQVVALGLMIVIWRPPHLPGLRDDQYSVVEHRLRPGWAAGRRRSPRDYLALDSRRSCENKLPRLRRDPAD